VDSNIILFCANSLNYPAICPTGLDALRPVVVSDCGAQIAMCKQVAGNTDPIRGGKSPGCCRGVSRVMRGDVDAETIF
jgi:hypothetical protein